MIDVPEDAGATVLMVHAHHALRMTQREFGELIGVSERTIQRWTASTPGFTPGQLKTLATALYPVHPPLAARFAALARETLESLGLVVPPPPKPSAMATPSLPPSIAPLLADGLLYALAEAVGLPRDKLELPLLELLRQSVEAGLSLPALADAVQQATVRRSRAVTARAGQR